MNLDECLYKKVCTNECSYACVRFSEMLALLEQSNIPEKRWKPIPLSPDDCDYISFSMLADIKDNIVNFVDVGRSLYIFSDKTGNGKTTWAIKLMLKYFDQVWAGNGFKPRGLFIHTPTFLTKLKDFNNRDEAFETLKSYIPTVDLVIWDDIGSVGMSAYDNSQLITYVDQRVLDGKANIYTGNIAGSELEKSIGTRLASRVWNASTVVEFRGADKRGQI